MSGVVITHPEKLMFPDNGITKGDLAEYYALVAPVMLPYMTGRPVTQERFHRGIAEEGFFQKNTQKGAPAWLERVTVPKNKGVVNYPVIRDARGLQWLVNQNCVTPHVWTTRVEKLTRPDLCVFDLDPLVDDAAAMRKAVLLLRDLLAELGCKCWVKTSGSKGFHVCVPLDATSEWETVARVGHAIGRELVRRDPDHLTQEFHKVDRGGRILVDTGRNEIGATHAAAYSVRPKPTAPISAPCTWEEVESGAVEPRSITLRGMAKRLEALGDVWEGMHQQPQILPLISAGHREASCE